MVLRSCWKSRHKNSSGPAPCWTRPRLAALFWLCVTQFVFGSGAKGETNNVIQKDAEFDVTYNDTVTSENQTIYAFNHTVSRNKTEGVRVFVDVLSQGFESPILFVVRQKQAVVSFQVPLILRGLYQRKYPYSHVGRTLCQPPTRAASETQYFFVDVSTLSSLGTNYQLRVSRVESFTLQTDKKFNFTASPSQPQYVFPDGVDTVIVKVNSEMTFPCSVMSIQDIQCPVYDLDNNVAFIGMYQTMTKKGAITVQRKDFPSNSFYVVVVVKTEDEACGGPLRFYPLHPDELIDAGNRSKFIDVIVTPAINSEVYVMGMLFCLGIFLSFYLLTLLMTCLENKRMKKREVFQIAADMSPAETADNGSTLSSEAITDSATSTDNNYGYMGMNKHRHICLLAYHCHVAVCLHSLACSWLPASNSGREPFKRRPILSHLHHIAIRIEQSLDSVGRSRQESLSSVEEDDYDTLDDINFDKNIVRTKKFLCVSDLSRKDKRILSKKYQIYFWNIATIAVFYALPVVQLVITYQTVVNVTGNQDICFYNFLCAHPMGALSAFNNILSNLGYVLLGLLFLLIVLKRDIVHNRALVRNDLNALECGIPKHFGLYYAMGTALMMEGLLSACYHLTFVCIFASDAGILRRIVYVIYTDCIRQCSGPMYIDRMVLLVMGNIVNWSLAAYGLIERPNDFASYLLAIAICNLLLYFAFYIIMKLRSGERIQCLALVCILFTAVKTPAESREHNRDCILLSFFDDHDIWHFLSSIAMFGSFLVLLTMDDDLDTVQRDKILAF
ncbi:hypothetical protein FQN60_004637 [Etheostoma spectabile]|uniref:SID1 transmembrane family member 2 n=1 Tax=Etheostoma spectabile TaxID=54343 RepID=A0A5J5DKK9_9PERO|nr:hypothetical protein FQN60_004637 [Etheostoma spectabile]